MSGMRAGLSRIHKAHKVDSHLQNGFVKSQTYTVPAGCLIPISLHSRKRRK